MRSLPVELSATPNTADLGRAAVPWQVSIAFAKTLYIAHHPEDEEARGESMSTMAAKALGEHGSDTTAFVAEALSRFCDFNIDDLRRTCPDDAAAQALIDKIAQQSLSVAARELFLPAGGFSSVARAKGTHSVLRQAEENHLDLLFSGLAVHTLYAMAQHNNLRGGASLNKVFYLLDKGSHNIKMPNGERRMREVWKSYKNVAHLGAAAYILLQKSNFNATDTGYLLDNLSAFLRMAKLFESFLLSFRSADGKTIVDPEQLWRVPVPESVSGPRDLPSGLTTSEQLWLADYRAPARL